MPDDEKPERTPAPDAKQYHKQHQVKKDAAEPVGAAASATSVEQKLRHYIVWYKTHKKISLPVTVVFLLALFFALPFTRYSALGLFLKQDFMVVVLDSQTNKPVSSASVTLGGKLATTDGKGEAKLNLSVGKARLLVDKQYYKSYAGKVVVPVKKQVSPFQVKLEATGTPVAIQVVNVINGMPITGVSISAGKAQAKTDQKGEATLVVPIGQKELKGSLFAEGYNKTDFTLQTPADTGTMSKLKLSPAGKIYFLSNASGKIDLVKSNLDGSERQVVLAGTGKEDRYNTVLLASRDWKYIALLSKRDGGNYAKLFLIETANDKVTTMDEGGAEFTLLGWGGDRFLYKVTRDKKTWEPKREALKSYLASANKITTLDETAAEGSQFGSRNETYGNAIVLDQELLYVKNWNSTTYLLPGNPATLNTVRADGSQKKTIKTYPPDVLYLSDTRLADFGELYIQYYSQGKVYTDEYRDGKVTQQKDSPSNSVAYPVYVVSPSGKKTLWSDFRDGKNVFFVGDGQGKNGKEIGSSEDFTPYGWFTDDYVLLTRKGSEMHIMSADGMEGGVEESLKVSDYYKPNYGYGGFGYGYGG